MSEIYKGPKFHTIFSDKKAIFHSLLHELIFWTQKFNQLGLTPQHECGTAGNLSIKINTNPIQFIITGAGLTTKNQLENQHFVLVEDVDIENRIVHATGCREPSSETMLHFQIYRNLQNVTAIFHGHHEGITAHAKHLSIPITKRACAYGSNSLVQSVLPLLGKCDFFVLKEHGFISLGNTMNDAGNNAIGMLDRYKMITNSQY
jgi:ribulose-5-phosphate 4-epimerase/fuculose-1-phosphate aldolase